MNPGLGRDNEAKAWGKNSESLPDPAGPRPQRYFAAPLGKISVADYFDQNSRSYDPRTQPDAVAVR